MHRFQSGKVFVNHKRFLGYTKNENGDIVVVPEQAEIVKRIYKEFLKGKSTRQIAKGLTLDGLKNGAGNTKWHESNIIQILKNEKYKGDARLQKTYTVDFLTKKRVRNNGIFQSYYVSESHEPITQAMILRLVRLSLGEGPPFEAFQLLVKTNMAAVSFFRDAILLQLRRKTPAFLLGNR